MTKLTACKDCEYIWTNSTELAPPKNMWYCGYHFEAYEGKWGFSREFGLLNGYNCNGHCPYFKPREVEEEK